MDCVVLAGGLPKPEDPMYALTQGETKALLPMNGRTMLERVIDALQSAKHVEDVVVVGLGSDLGMQFKRPVHHLPDHGGLISNGMAGLEWLAENKPGTTHFLGVTSDIPLMTGQMVDDFIEMCQPLDRGIYYNFVSKETMEARFPHSTRTYVKLKGMQVAGGDIGMIHVDLRRETERLEMLENARKHAWKIARVVGLRMMIKLLLRQVTFNDIEETAYRLTGISVKVVLNPYAEMAMDGDKPAQVTLLRDELIKLEGATHEP